VFFPDDDSLWFKGVSDRIMRIYERDRDEQIGAACPSESPVPPSPYGTISGAKAHALGLKKISGNLINRFERKFFMDPIYIEGFFRINEKAAPDWLNEEDASLFGPMTGFQMSFRTEVIQRWGFDETLGRYALMEDRDASLHVLQDRLIVCCNGARVFHYKAPGKRTDDFEWGFINMLNRAYVVCKHTQPGAKARSIRRLRGAPPFRRGGTNALP